MCVGWGEVQHDYQETHGVMRNNSWSYRDHSIIFEQPISLHEMDCSIKNKYGDSGVVTLELR